MQYAAQAAAYTTHAGSCVTSWFVSAPLRALFERGPGWIGWQGRNYADVCAELTGSPATFWETHMDECSDIVDKRFQSFEIVVQFVVYGYLLFTITGLLVRACIFRWTVVLPVERLLANANFPSISNHSAGRYTLRSSPRRQISAAP